MTDVRERQQLLLQSVDRVLENFKKIGKNNYTPAKVRSRINALKELWSQCIHCNAAFIKAFPNEETAAERALALHEDIFQTALDYMAEVLEEVEPPVCPNQSFASVAARSDSSSLSLQHLPQIPLPPFTGKIEEWETFRDRFHSLIIQNKELSNFSRMHFLASSLTGCAREVISDISITAENFDVAWKALGARYENKRRLIETHVATFYNLPAMSRESASELHALRDKVDKALAALQRLDRSSEDILNDILVYSLSQKLDPATRRA
ncbi:hypothetical protein ALC62_01023 [Cyphomyrmex costatus]|uniref:Uncharacterized protein n=1 Tax=Cyphomyrmex costatus TaxID=456900 RepID=A0A151K2W1_9HYME|nr:hypothetical protein ALC62_01023 [Cyphomyrmex costatus]